MTIPLSPAFGGQSIDASSLRRADIIVSTTNALVSRGIRALTVSPTSHAILYIGDGEVIEAIGSGVTHRRLAEAISDATLAVAYRLSSLQDPLARRVVSYAWRQVGKPYHYGALAAQVYCVDAGIRCKVAQGFVHVDSQFFCSELVLRAYQRAGAPLGPIAPEQSSPQDIVYLHMARTLEYVGHLKA